MPLLPDITEEGKLVLSKEDLLIKHRYDRDWISPERKALFKKNIEEIKAKYLERDLMKVERKVKKEEHETEE